MWKSLTGGPIRDLVLTLRALMEEHELTLHIGSDSQEIGDHTDYVTVIAALTPGRGGRVFYRRERERGSQSIAQRLFREAQLSIDVALELAREVTPEISVHVDANEDARHKSSNYVQALAGMVVGYGFRVRLKPESWCASHVADRLVKSRSTRAA